jgi:iron complex outermembrane receptor protein
MFTGLKGLAYGASAIALAMATTAAAQTPGLTSSPQVATPAVGEANTEAEDLAEVVVTGTSIRGAAPVGSNLISVGQEAIQATPAQSMQQVLKSVPQITGSSTASQGGFQSNDAAGSYAPTIHALGGSASTTTLVLVDSHRIPLTGVTHALADPNLVPAIAIERVEVLADGASSIYGSDAIAGVINFITRRRYDGFEASAQAGFGEGYHTASAGFIAGTVWDSGSAFFAYNYSNRSNLSRGDRDFARPDQRANGGTNFANFNCSPATIGIGSNIFRSPYTGAPVTNAGANSFCDYTGVTDLFPEEIRNNGMIKIIQEVGDKLTLQVDAVYSYRTATSQNSRGTVNATVFGPGSGRAGQINPFFQAVPGQTATSYTVRYDFNDLFGSGATNKAFSEDFYVHSSAAYDFTDNWRLEFNGVAGMNNSGNINRGSVSGSSALLALNGTTNEGGSLTAPSVASTGQIVLQTPLTTENALDVWNLGTANRTSAATRARLLDNHTNTDGRQTILNGRLQLSGTLATLPGGDLRVAGGLEYSQYEAEAIHVSALGTGGTSTGSLRREFIYPTRKVKSAYAELLIPLVAPEMELPFVRSLSVNLSGRIDDYNDVGSTENPKIAANWEVFEGLKLRGNWARSFVAPQVQASGIPPLGLAGETGYYRSNGGDAQVTLPFSIYPEVRNLPGCQAQIAANSSITGCRLAQPGIEGVEVRTGADLAPQTGETWSVGGDYTPAYVPGLRLSLTYWNSQVKGGITAPAQTLASGAPSLRGLYTFFPTATGATAAELNKFIGGIPQNNAIPAVVSYVYDRRYRNLLNLYVSGIDADFSYARDTDFGRFTIGNALTYLTKFDQNFGDDPKFSITNSSGFNLTFPSIRLTGRANIGWEQGPWAVDAFVNYVGKYSNYSTSSVAPIIRDQFGNPTGGGDDVKGNATLDLHVAYTIPNMFEKVQVSLDVQNVFDKEPSFFNTSTGYDMFSGNPLGRIVTVGLRAAF